MEPAGAPVSFENPTSGPGGRFKLSKLSSPQPSTAFPLPLVHPLWQAAILYMGFAYLVESASTDFKVLQRRVRPPVKPVNIASQQLVEGWDFYL